MTEFVLKLDLSNHEHHHAAQHAVVRQLLGLASQAIGASPLRKGELTTPLWDASQGVSRHVPVGSWEFIAPEAAPREVA